MRVLLVEPDRILGRTYARALRRAGHKVRLVSSAQAAVYGADTARPDIVVLELQLPMHNGVEFLYEFRSYSEWLDIPVVVHSFVPLHEVAAPTLQRELGVRQFLYKPATSLARLTAAVAAYGVAHES